MKKDYLAKIEKVLYYMVFIIMILAFAGALYKTVNPNIKSSEDLRLLQSFAGCIIILVPYIFEKYIKIRIPSLLTIAFLMFIFASVVLGEFYDFYYKISIWDGILHLFSGALIAIFCASLLQVFTQGKIKEQNVWFIFLFTISTAIFVGVIWEIYEYVWDVSLGLNMQKYALQDGTPLIGQAALTDTMMDLVADLAGASLGAGLVTWMVKRKPDYLDAILIEKIK